MSNPDLVNSKPTEETSEPSDNTVIYLCMLNMILATILGSVVIRTELVSNRKVYSLLYPNSYPWFSDIMIGFGVLLIIGAVYGLVQMSIELYRRRR